MDASQTHVNGHASPLRRRLAWVAVVGWMAVIFGLSSWQDPGVPQGWTSPGHAALYFVLGLLLFEALAPSRDPLRALAMALIVASLYGISDELHQAFVPTRTPDPIDWAWDTVGAALGTLAGLGVLRLAVFRRRRGTAAAGR